MINSISDEDISLFSHSPHHQVNYTSFLTFDNESALIPYMNATANGLTPETPIKISNLNINLAETDFNCGINLSNIHLYVQIQNCRIQGTSSFHDEHGISIQNSSNIHIIGNYFQNFWNCLDIFDVSNILISNNHFQMCPYSISLSHIDKPNTNLTIKNNYLENSGVVVGTSINLRFENNTLYANRSQGRLYFIGLQNFYFNWNTILPLQMESYCRNQGFWMYFWNITNFQILDSYFSGNYNDFVQLINATAGEIAQNTFFFEDYNGIDIYDSNQINIHDNQFKNSFLCRNHNFWDYQSQIEKLNSDKTEEESWDSGIFFDNVNNSNIEKNHISYYKYGIILVESKNNTISENYISFNSIEAIYCDDPLENNILNNYISEIFIWDIPYLFLISDSVFLICSILPLLLISKKNHINQDVNKDQGSTRVGIQREEKIESMYKGSYSGIMYVYVLILSFILFLFWALLDLNKTRIIIYIIIFHISFFIHTAIRYGIHSNIFKPKLFSIEGIESKKHSIQNNLEVSNRSILFVELFDLLGMGIALFLLIVKAIEFGLILAHSLPGMKILYMEYITPLFFMTPLLSSGFWVFKEGSLFKFVKERIQSLFPKQSDRLPINQI